MGMKGKHVEAPEYQEWGFNLAQRLRSQMLTSTNHRGTHIH